MRCLRNLPLCRLAFYTAVWQQLIITATALIESVGMDRPNCSRTRAVNKNAKRMGRICCALIVVILICAQMIILRALITLRDCCNWIRSWSSITQERWHSRTTDKSPLNPCITTSRTLGTTTKPDSAGVHQLLTLVADLSLELLSVKLLAVAVTVLVFEAVRGIPYSTTDMKANFVIPDMTEADGHHDIHYAFVK